MKRWSRWAFHSAAAGSAILLLASLSMWVKSDLDIVHVEVAEGRLFLVIIHPDRTHPQAADQYWTNTPGAHRAFQFLQPFAVSTHSWAGYENDWGDGSAPSNPLPTAATFRLIAVPCWIFTVVSLPLPMVWLLMVNRHRGRQANNQCLQCGYDLRATVKRCPECGTPKSAAS